MYDKGGTWVDYVDAGVQECRRLIHEIMGTTANEAMMGSAPICKGFLVGTRSIRHKKLDVRTEKSRLIQLHK